MPNPHLILRSRSPPLCRVMPKLSFQFAKAWSALDGLTQFVQGSGEFDNYVRPVQNVS